MLLQFRMSKKFFGPSKSPSTWVSWSVASWRDDWQLVGPCTFTNTGARHFIPHLSVNHFPHVSVSAAAPRVPLRLLSPRSHYWIFHGASADFSPFSSPAHGSAAPSFSAGTISTTLVSISFRERVQESFTRHVTGIEDLLQRGGGMSFLGACYFCCLCSLWVWCCSLVLLCELPLSRVRSVCVRVCVIACLSVLPCLCLFQLCICLSSFGAHTV